MIEPMMQLNPFALPSETQGRFRMLVVAALAAALNIGVAWTNLMGREAELQRLWDEHMVLLRQVADATFFKLTPAVREAVAERADALIQAMLTIYLGNLLIPLLYVSILSILAFLIYRRHPQRIRRQFRALPLTAEKAPAVVRDVNQMVEALNLSPPPSMEHSQGTAKLLEAQAFGLKRSPVLLLKGSPEFLEELWDDKYKAVALHELAHIKEGDAQDRERARAVWRVLLVLGYLPLAFVTLAGRFFAWSYDGGRLFRLPEVLAVQLALTLWIVFSVSSGLIRIRELYADWRVAMWGWREPLVAAFRSNPEWWHPSAKTRKANLERSERLFRVSSGLPLQTGLLLALAVGNGFEFDFLLLRILMFLGLRRQWHIFASLVELPAGWKSSFALLPQMLLSNLLPPLTGAVLFFVLARLVSGTLDLQVQREAVADLATGKHENWGYLKLLRPAFLLAVGFEAGLLFAPNTHLTPESQWLIPARATAMTLLSWLWLVSMRAFTRLSCGSHATYQAPKQPQAAWFSSLILTLLCWPIAVASFSLRTFQKTSTMDLPSIGLPRVVFLLEWPIAYTLLLFILLYILAAGSALVQVSTSLLKVRSCPICGDRATPRLVVGRACQTCGNPLTPWLYPRKADLLQIASDAREVKP
jgi:hypothetical protein